MAHMVKRLGWRLATQCWSPCCHGAEWTPVLRSSSCWRHERILKLGIHWAVVMSLANSFNPEAPWCFWHKCNAVASKENIPQPEKSPTSVLGAIFTLIQLQRGCLMELCLFYCVPQFNFYFHTWKIQKDNLALWHTILHFWKHVQSTLLKHQLHKICLSLHTVLTIWGEVIWLWWWHQRNQKVIRSYCHLPCNNYQITECFSSWVLRSKLLLAQGF